jgi:hypothetical protein
MAKPRVSQQDHATAAERASQRQHGTLPYDRCRTCQRKVVRGVGVCVHCASAALYGPWDGRSKGGR